MVARFGVRHVPRAPALAVRTALKEQWIGIHEITSSSSGLHGTDGSSGGSRRG